MDDPLTKTKAEQIQEELERQERDMGEVDPADLYAEDGLDGMDGDNEDGDDYMKPLDQRKTNGDDSPDEAHDLEE